MTTLGAPTMTDAEMRQWAETMTEPKAKYGGTPPREDHAWKVGGIASQKRRAVAAQVARTPCLEGEAHRYRIPEPDGRHTLPATCTKCGTVREFVVAGDTDWFSEELRQGKGRNGGAE